MSTKKMLTRKALKHYQLQTIVAVSVLVWLSSNVVAQWTVTNLHPAGAVFSEAFAASGSLQAGSAEVGGNSHASLWNGTAASWVDLHAFLPAEFSTSEARGITTDGIITYISGSGFNTATGRTEALLWTPGVPEPGTAGLLCLGSILLAVQRRRKTA